MQFPIDRHDDDLLEPASETEHLATALQALPLWLRTGSDRPVEFWEQQRAAIVSRLAAKASQPALAISGKAWVLAFGVLAIAFLLLVSGPRVTQSRGTPSQTAADPDRELLMEVEYAVESEGPEALEPAALLAQEIDRYHETNLASPAAKEANHEE
jgi:hypothetical protein